MAQTFTTLEAFRNHLLGRTKVAMECTIDEIKNHLMEILDDRIYSYAEGEYDRSGMLREESNWVADNISHSGTISFDLHFDENQYYVNGWEHIHGLCWGGGNTELPGAETFIKVLNENKSDLFGGVTPNTDGFWDEFIEWVNEHYDEILMKNITLQGIDVLKY